MWAYNFELILWNRWRVDYVLACGCISVCAYVSVFQNRCPGRLEFCHNFGFWMISLGPNILFAKVFDSINLIADSLSRIQKVLSSGCPTLTFYLSRWGERGAKYHVKGGNHRGASKAQFKWRWCPNNECRLGSFVIFQGTRTSIAKEPYSFVIFQGGGPDPLSPLWIHAWIFTG